MVSDCDVRYNIKVVARACSVLFAFDDEHPSMNLGALNNRLGIPKPTLLRILTTLVDQGLLERDDERYALGARVLTLSHHFLRQTSLTQLCSQPFRALARELDLSVSLAMLDGLDVVYLAVENPAHQLGLQGDVGLRHPAHATAVGKVLLAHLTPTQLRERITRRPLRRLTDATITDPDRLIEHLYEARARGYAVDDGERGIGIRCVAVPIRDATGAVIASMSCAGPTGQIEQTTLDDLVRRLDAVARDVSGKLGYRV